MGRGLCRRCRCLGMGAVLLVAGSQLPGGPGAGYGTTTDVPVRWAIGAGARPRQTAITVNAAVAASTRAMPTAIGAGSGWPLGSVGAVGEPHEVGRFVEHSPHIGLGQRADALMRTFPVFDNRPGLCIAP